MGDMTDEYYELFEVYSKNVIASKTDLQGKIVYVSDAFCDISGYTREELIDKPHSIVRHPDMTKAFFKKLWETIKSSKTFKGEIKNRRKDGSAYWVDVTIAPLLDDFANIVGYTAIRHDITKTKEYEELNKKYEKLLKECSDKK